MTPISVKSLGRNEQYVDIYEGLNVGDTVITSGILQLKPGMRIQTQITPQNQ